MERGKVSSRAVGRGQSTVGAVDRGQLAVSGRAVGVGVVHRGQLIVREEGRRVISSKKSGQGGIQQWGQLTGEQSILGQWSVGRWQLAEVG